MRVLALAPLPVEAAATRLRLTQLQGPLADRGIDLTIHPFVDSATFATLYDRGAWPRTAARLTRAAIRRIPDVWNARHFDAVLVQREAMLFGPPVVERLAARAQGTALVLDLDDATYVAYDSPTYGRFARWLKWPGKTDTLISMADGVTCGSRAIADYVMAQGTPATPVPTVVDLDVWVPRNKENDPPVIGWVGSHSTFPYLEAIVPALQDVARDHRFRLLVVGSGRRHLEIPGVDVEHRPWSLEREVRDFQELDIGLYPLPADDPWAAGKSGLKAVQYMAVGVPYVASPVGAAAEMGVEHLTHLFARSPDAWRQALSGLLADADRRKRMGEAARANAEFNYPLVHAAEALARALFQAAAGRSGAHPPGE